MPRQRRVAVQLSLEWAYKRHTKIFAGAQQYALEHDWQTIIVDEYAEDTLTRCKENTCYDGVIARASKKLALLSQEMQIPVVNVWISSPACDLVPSVLADSAAMGQMRAEHLLSRGLRRFASLTFHDDRAERLELLAFTSKLNAAGFTCNSLWLPYDSGTALQKWRKMQTAISDWMDHWELPIGVFVGAEMPGRLVAQECLKRGFRVPEDVAIIAGRNEEALCESPRPTLSSIEVGFERVGYEAARLLDKLMQGKKAPADPLLIPPAGVVIRESTDFFAVDDETVMSAIKFISQNSHRDLSPDDVAHAIAIEPRTLHRYFQKHLNRPVAREILRVRLERAKRELVQGKRSMEEIARAVGFGNALRMCNVFQRELGVSPRQYRKERQ
jgi:LacI family transcriptional regulator